MNDEKLVELVDVLYEAQEHLQDAIRCLEIYVKETDDRSAEAYLVDHLKIMASSNHGFLSRDLNVDDLISCVLRVD